MTTLNTEAWNFIWVSYKQDAGDDAFEPSPATSLDALAGHGILSTDVSIQFGMWVDKATAKPTAPRYL